MPLQTKIWRGLFCVKSVCNSCAICAPMTAFLLRCQRCKTDEVGAANRWESKEKPPNRCGATTWRLVTQRGLEPHLKNAEPVAALRQVVFSCAIRVQSYHLSKSEKYLSIFLLYFLVSFSIVCWYTVLSIFSVAWPMRCWAYLFGTPCASMTDALMCLRSWKR